MPIIIHGHIPENCAVGGVTAAGQLIARFLADKSNFPAARPGLHARMDVQA